MFVTKLSLNKVMSRYEAELRNEYQGLLLSLRSSGFVTETIGKGLR